MKVLKSLFKLILIIVLLIFMIFAFSFGIVYYQTSRQNISYQDKIYKYADKYSVDPMLVASIIKVESDFNNDAHSNQDAQGLMQLLDKTARHSAELIGEDYYPDKLKEVDYNLDLGVGYFDYLYRYYNDTNLALAAYNGGIGNVDKWIEDGTIDSKNPDITKIPIEETRQYVMKINATYDVFTSLYKDKLPSKEMMKSRRKLSIKNYKAFLENIKADIF